MSTELVGLVAGALLGAWVLVVGVCRVKRANDQWLNYYAEHHRNTAHASPSRSAGEQASASVPPKASSTAAAPPLGK